MNQQELAHAPPPTKLLLLLLLSLTPPPRQALPPPAPDRPFLREFGRNINQRILHSKEGRNHFGSGNHYTSAETIPCLDMKCGPSCNDAVSSPADICDAFIAGESQLGRSSGSGCSIVRLRGSDAASIRGLVKFSHRFFDGVDDDECNERIDNVGVFRIDSNVHAGFDCNVNGEGRMQVLYTKLIPSTSGGEGPTLLSFEVGDLVGPSSLSDAHDGMKTLLNIGSQITSAVLCLDDKSSAKLLDDCTHILSDEQPQSLHFAAKDVSNSYQRLIRYLEPPPADLDSAAAFWPHVDSTFLTLIPMPELPGLEVWCPSKQYADSVDLSRRGEWVRPLRPSELSSPNEVDDDGGDATYVIALAGEFLQLLSNGRIPTCIHCVIPPKPPPATSLGLKSKYRMRISAPLFIRPRRGKDAILDTREDLNHVGNGSSSTCRLKDKGLYFEEGLIGECNKMRIWEYMDYMSPDN